ncbi:MAG: hypothetical protein Q8O26_14925 [Phreatobacter sp.]|uniref:hypothetical protein n=1 Tax=Phreatobacter sp. TaxID=1966341 RepID=UPI00273366A7|nr:hypothetical protein [Phreatobacter sp.]MDP2803165.1 hypothetical protein [Phreatobacter sp.]
MPVPPAADPVVPPAPAATAPRVEPAPATETAQKPGESEGVLIDGRFLGPNGESLPPAGGAPATPGIRQVTPPASN